MAVTRSFDEKWRLHLIAVNGLSFTGVTEATGEAAVARLVALCELHEAEITAAIKAANARREWNMANSDKAKNWPEFGKLSKLTDALAAQAGIKDS